MKRQEAEIKTDVEREDHPWDALMDRPIGTGPPTIGASLLDGPADPRRRALFGWAGAAVIAAAVTGGVAGRASNQAVRPLPVEPVLPLAPHLTWENNQGILRRWVSLPPTLSAIVSRDLSAEDLRSHRVVVLGETVASMAVEDIILGPGLTPFVQGVLDLEDRVRQTLTRLHAEGHILSIRGMPRVMQLPLTDLHMKAAAVVFVELAPALRGLGQLDLWKATGITTIHEGEQPPREEVFGERMSRYSKTVANLHTDERLRQESLRSHNK